jgi:hypothetical protein
MSARPLLSIYPAAVDRRACADRPLKRMLPTHGTNSNLALCRFFSGTYSLSENQPKPYHAGPAAIALSLDVQIKIG